MIPTAEEIFDSSTIGLSDTTEYMYCQRDVVKKAIEFAQMHVEAAKEQFKIVFSEIDNPYPFEYNDPLEDVYPLTNIK